MRERMRSKQIADSLDTEILACYVSFIIVEGEPDEVSEQNCSVLLSLLFLQRVCSALSFHSQGMGNEKTGQDRCPACFFGQMTEQGKWK